MQINWKFLKESSNVENLKNSDSATMIIQNVCLEANLLRRRSKVTVWVTEEPSCYRDKVIVLGCNGDLQI